MNIRFKKAPQGITLLEVIITLCLIALLAAVLLPAMARSRKSPRIHCVNLLKQIGLANRVWTGDNGDKSITQISTNSGGMMEPALAGDVFSVFLSLSNELSTPKVLRCPCDAKLVEATNFQMLREENISYFLSVDQTSYGTNNLVSGDRNITNGMRLKAGLLELYSKTPTGWTKAIHQGAGNFLMADGSVRMVNNTSLQDEVSRLEPQPTRIALPLSNRNPSDEH